jgi:large-conductance mechanosensitive channel
MGSLLSHICTPTSLYLHKYMYISFNSTSRLLAINQHYVVPYNSLIITIIYYLLFIIIIIIIIIYCCTAQDACFLLGNLFDSD